MTGYYGKKQALARGKTVVFQGRIPGEYATLLVQHRADVARQIKSKLLFYSIHAPFSAQQQWTGPYLRWVKGLCWEEARQ